ncbi:MAG: glycoside hydrolase, partial [Acidobacteriaceae bacterium]
DFDGSVYVRHNTKIDVQVRNGVAIILAIESGATQQLRIRNPWAGQPVTITAYISGKEIDSQLAGEIISFHALASVSYLIERSASARRSLPFEKVNGETAISIKKLGTVQIGLGSADGD